MFIFKIKREQAQFTAKNSAQTVHVYIFHNLNIYSCSAEERELKNMLKDIKKYKHKIQIKNNTLLINKLPINSSHTHSPKYVYRWHWHQKWHLFTRQNLADQDWFSKYISNTISIVLKKEVFSHIEKLLKTWNYYNAVEEAYKKAIDLGKK